MKPIVDIKALTKRYKGAGEFSVNPLDLKISSGEIFGLLGPNGAGKLP